MPGKNNAKPVPPAPAGDRPETWRRALFWGLLLVGLLLRVLWLGRASYMIDEINVVRDAVTSKSIAAIWATELERFTWYHRLPVLMTFIHISAKLFGFTGPFPAEWIARLPFALIGTGALPLFYLLGKSLRDRTTGLWAMGLATFSIFHNFYSREAYDYSLLMFFALGTVWAGIELLREWADRVRFRWKQAGIYMAFSAGLLYSHLAGLLFLVSWTAVMALAVAWPTANRKALLGMPLLQWLVTLGAAYFAFLPFLVRLMGGFSNQDNAQSNKFSWTVLPQVLGRMGWGGHPATLAVFVFFLGFGAWCAVRWFRDSRRLEGAALLVQALLYFAVQSWALRISRFEIRYYSALFPILVIVSAAGVVESIRWLAARLKFARPAVGYGVLSVALLGWMGYGSWLVSRLECRGYNYKGIANWIMQNVPPRGVAFFYNIYELRGVPNTYPVPDRYVSYVAAWSTDEDRLRAQPPKRVALLFARFPQTYFVELIPEDILRPDQPGVDKIPRDPVLRRRVWLIDPAFEKLAKLKLHPFGDAQWFSLVQDHVLISYNQLDDMPYLAASRNRPFFHYFGSDWDYTKDQQMNDWLVTAGSATLYLGNITDRPGRAQVRMAVAAVPSGGRLTIFGPDGKPILSEAAIPASFHELVIPNVELKPGTSVYSVQVLPQQGALDVQLLLYGVDVQPAAPAPAAPPPAPAPQAQSH